MASNSSLPAITSSLERDLRTWTDRVRDTLNATGDNRLVRQKDLLGYLDQIKKDLDVYVKNQAVQTASTQSAGTGATASGDVTNYFGGSGFEGAVADVIAKMGAEILNSKLTKDLMEPINDELNKRVTEIRSRLDKIRSEYDAKVSYVESNAQAAIYQEYITRRDGDALIAQSVELLDVKVEDNAAAIFNEQTARVSATEALAETVQLLDTQVGDANAAILNEQTVRASENSALSSQVSNVTTTVDGVQTSVQTLAQSVDGVMGEYTVKVDSAGKITGFGLIGTPTSSQFSIYADNFSVIADSGGTPVTPFFTSGGQTYIKEAFIANASIDSVKLGGVPYVVEQVFQARGTPSGAYSGSGAITVSGLAPGETARIVATIHVQTGFAPAPESGFGVTWFDIAGWRENYYTHIGHSFSLVLYDSFGNGVYPVSYTINGAGLPFSSNVTLSIRAIR